MEQQNQSNLFSNVTFDLTARQHLRSLASWSMVIVVVAVISYTLSLISMTKTPKPIMSEGFGFEYYMRSTSTSPFWTVIFVAIGLLLVFFLYRFASRLKSGLEGQNKFQVAEGFRDLKTYFMGWSIIVIVLFVIILLVFVGLLLVKTPTLDFIIW